jgi:Flp pilus assembly protein CpaB
MTYRARNILVAVALALVAALLTTFYVTNYKRNVQSGEDTVKVFVAAQDVPAGTPGSELVKKKLLTEENVAKRTVVPGAISDPEQVQRLVLTQPVYAGEQVTARRFGSLQQQGIQAKLKGTLRAFQLPGDQNQLLAGTLKDGDHVDLVAAVKPDPSKDERVTRIVLRDIEVLRAPESPEISGKLTNTSAGNVHVMLAVRDTQVQKLVQVTAPSASNDWSLQLRPVVDPADSPETLESNETVITDGLRQSELSNLPRSGR